MCLGKHSRYLKPTLDLFLTLTVLCTKTKPEHDDSVLSLKTLKSCDINTCKVSAYLWFADTDTLANMYSGAGVVNSTTRGKICVFDFAVNFHFKYDCFLWQCKHITDDLYSNYTPHPFFSLAFMLTCVVQL